MIQLIIPGQPMVKSRARKGPHGFYTPSETRAHEDMIAMYARSLGERFPPDVPLRVDVRFFVGAGKSSQHPDLDNLVKALLDGLQKGELIKDDRQVSELHALRFDGQAKPRTEVTIVQTEREGE